MRDDSAGVDITRVLREIIGAVREQRVRGSKEPTPVKFIPP